jgi:hypothetical protein
LLFYLHFVKYRHSQGTIRVSGWEGHIIKNLQKVTIVGVPVAKARIYDLVYVFTFEGRYWNKGAVSVGVIT